MGKMTDSTGVARGGNARDDPGELSAAEARVTALNVQADGLRRHVAELRESLAQAENSSTANQLAQLREANEKLLLAVLQANASAEVAAANLRELARANQHDALTGTPNRAVLLERLGHRAIVYISGPASSWAPTASTCRPERAARPGRGARRSAPATRRPRAPGA